jgi:hypothetical protein
MVDKTDEKALAPVGDNVSYALVVQKTIAGVVQVRTFVAGKPMFVPAVGDYFETQGATDHMSGKVAAVNHSLNYSGGTAPFITCVAWLILV